MTFDELLNELERRNIVPELLDDKLSFPVGVLTDELRQAVLENREALIKHLTPVPKAAPSDEQAKIVQAAHVEMWDFLKAFGVSRDIPKAELLNLAEAYRAKWQDEKLSRDRRGMCRTICGMLYEVTGEVHRIKELGYEVPRWYNSSPSEKETED